jgi:hypothetical protein
MAQWINFPVVGGHDGTGAVPAEDGDNLLLAESIVSVSVAETANRMTATLTLRAPTAATDVCTVLCSTDAAATDPDTARCDAAGYEAQLKAAINRAITANPGGVKSTVSLPLDQDNQAKYDFSKTVYFKSFKIA